eukprot:2213913-Amphidinium_carterae.1
MAYLNKMVVKDEISAAEAVEVESLSENEKLEMLLDSSFNMTADDVEFFCKQDRVWNTYKLYAPVWADIVKEHMMIHELSSFSYDSDEGQLIWTHTSVDTRKQKLAELCDVGPVIQLGPCYAFPSATQSISEIATAAPDNNSKPFLSHTPSFDMSPVDSQTSHLA